jgi:hypothetical protein
VVKIRFKRELRKQSTVMSIFHPVTDRISREGGNVFNFRTLYTSDYYKKNVVASRQIIISYELLHIRMNVKIIVLLGQKIINVRLQ